MGYWEIVQTPAATGDWKKFKFQLNSKASDAEYDSVAGMGMRSTQFIDLI